MLRTHTCGELRLKNKDERVQLSGWVQGIRDIGGMVWLDLRDRYGITQLIIEERESSNDIMTSVRNLGREYVIQVEGIVKERESKNDKIPTGDIEIFIDQLKVLNKAKLPPFLIEDNTDGGDELRMKYRYLDLRRKVVRDSLRMRHKMAQQNPYIPR